MNVDLRRTPNGVLVFTVRPGEDPTTTDDTLAARETAAEQERLRALTRALAAEADASALIDRVFDAFDEGGAGQLAAWLALSGEQRRFEPIRRAVLDLVAAAGEKFAHDATADHRIRLLVLLIAICAFGDAVIGPHLRDMLGEDDKAGRRLLTQLLPLVLVQLS